VRARPSASGSEGVDDAACAADGPLWTGEEERYRRATQPVEPGAADPAQDPAEVARDICLRELAVRPRTRAELATALRRRGIAGEVAAEVLDRYDEVGLIDDEAFARAWVTSRHHGRGLARRALAGELRQRGVDGETVGAALTELDPSTEKATARELVERKLRGMGRAAPDAVFRRLVAMLARKGYPAGLAFAVVKDVLAARDAESAAFAEAVDPDALADLAGDSDDLPG
jgi:regulatory protein